MQEVYLAVWKQANTFDPNRGTAIAWLATIAHNRAIDRLRQMRSRPTVQLDASSDNVASLEPNSLDLALVQADQEELARCLALIDPADADMLRTTFLEGLSYSDLAQRLGLPLGTVKSRIRRALIKLRGLIR